MSINRIELLEQYLEDDPDDEFTMYALALEYVKLGEYMAAKNFFSTLVNKHPGYLPAYYQFGKLNEILNEKEKANELYRDGMELAKKQHDQHTLNELLEAFNSLNGIDDED
jgi:tetratricopeptide (TPR) repeat protein